MWKLLKTIRVCRHFANRTWKCMSVITNNQLSIDILDSVLDQIEACMPSYDNCSRQFDNSGYFKWYVPLIMTIGQIYSAALQCHMNLTK